MKEKWIEDIYIYICVYVYMKRERENTCIYIYIYIYVFFCLPPSHMLPGSPVSATLESLLSKRSVGTCETLELLRSTLSHVR